MKLWQLMSIMDGEKALLRSIASSQTGWGQFVTWIDDFENLVRAQDRSKLDYVLPDDMVRLALARSEKACFLDMDGWLRSRRMSPDDVLLPVLEIYQRFGGDLLEEVFDKGAVAVS
jgi:hypothetical protein